MDDVLQTAYLNAFRSRAGFEGRAQLGTWLYRIVYNACLDELRRGGRTTSVPLDVLDEPGRTTAPVVGGPPDPASTVVLRLELAAALAALPHEQRAAVLLVDADGLPYTEAAEVLGVPRGTLASQLHRARAELRRVLTANGVHDGPDRDHRDDPDQADGADR